MSAWSHLPNAAHIDRVLADVQARPEAWAAAWAAERSAAWAAVRAAARDAILALIAWDDCDHLLETDAEHVRVLALLGHLPAVLLLPAAIALNKVKQLETV